MHMTFWLDYNINELLFPNLQTTSVGGLILVILVVMILAAVYEDIKVLLAWIKFNAAAARSPHKMRCMNDGPMSAASLPITKSQRALWFLLELSLYVFEVLLGYIVMLLVMTYNGYLFIAVLIGSGLSYFIFGPSMMRIRLKTSKLKIPCDKCPKVEESTTSSTEAITFSESTTNFISDPPCCTRDINAEVHGDC
jgi:hypothetical protein